MRLELTTLLIAVLLTISGCALHRRPCPSVTGRCPKYVAGVREHLPEGCKLKCDDVGCYIEEVRP